MFNGSLDHTFLNLVMLFSGSKVKNNNLLSEIQPNALRIEKFVSVEIFK